MQTQSFKELAEKILLLKSKHNQKLVGIDGGGGAGKSTFAKNLQEHLPNSAIIHIDDFYKGPWNKRLDDTDYDINPFFDWARFHSEVLRPLQDGKQIQYHVYDWHTHTADTVVSVTANAMVIVEGGYTIQQKFANLYDFKIWIETDEDLRLKQALLRDGEHMRFLWEEDWLPVERNYIRTYNPFARADLVVKGQALDFSKGYFEIIKD